MGKNLTLIIAKELGLEEYEVFAIKGVKDYKFRFAYDDLQYLYDGDKEWEDEYDGYLHGLVLGQYEVEKLPFEPKNGEVYWTFTSYSVKGDQWVVVNYEWSGCPFDCMALKLGCTFRTKEEAYKAFPTKYKELTGKE